ncbi:hypothetical protein [uncultured Ruegeria sp.]|uniref:hypothetical protein n=1 Tax=uncultured Ruegeria sp. TaxID=259304 RepID=UPI0026081FDD|nr:hypothetical protein [uncultured Ruegeria sp.]
MIILELPVLREASVFTAKAALILKALEGQDAYEGFANAMVVQSDTVYPASVRGAVSTDDLSQLLRLLLLIPKEMTTRTSRDVIGGRV